MTPTPGTATGRWRLGDTRYQSAHEARFDADTGSLRVDGQTHALEAGQARLLAVLLAQAGQAVSRETLLREAWERDPALLSRNVLTNAIARLRRLLGDDHQQVIITMQRLGYRIEAQPESTPARPALLAGLRTGAGLPGRSGWRLTEALAGGHATRRVWRALDPQGRRCVVKFAEEAREIAALRHEAAAARLLIEAHGEAAGFAPMIDARLEGPLAWLAMPDLGRDLASLAASGGLARLDTTQRLELLAALAERVAQAHAVGVLHGDIKPANALLGADGAVWLIDFGSGRLGHDPGEGATAGGTLAYLAPERLRGGGPGTAADVYALGVMLYQLLVGDLRRPLVPGFEAAIADPLLRQDISAAVHGDPQLRLASARDLAVRLRELPQRHTADAARLQAESAAAEAEQLVRRNRTRRPWLLLLTAILISGLLSSLWLRHTALQQRAVAQEQLQRADALQGFVDDGLIKAADPFRSGDTHVTLVDAIRHAAASVDADITDPARRMDLEIAFARELASLGRLEEALQQAQRAAANGGSAAIYLRDAISARLAFLQNAPVPPLPESPPGFPPGLARANGSDAGRETGLTPAADTSELADWAEASAWNAASRGDWSAAAAHFDAQAAAQEPLSRAARTTAARAALAQALAGQTDTALQSLARLTDSASLPEDRAFSAYLRGCVLALSGQHAQAAAAFATSAAGYAAAGEASPAAAASALALEGIQNRVAEAGAPPKGSVDSMGSATTRLRSPSPDPRGPLADPRALADWQRLLWSPG